MLDSHKKRKTKPFQHYNGSTTVWNEEIFIRDLRFPQIHHRYDVARIHRHLAEDGTPGGTGLYDPKEMMIGDVNYRKYETAKAKLPRCELCERGDMIPLRDRFYDSKYKPDWHIWKRAFMWAAGIFFRIRISVKAGRRHMAVRLLRMV